MSDLGRSHDVWDVLYTTRAHRRLAADPVPEEVVARIFDAAVRAPSGGNQQRFRFLTVTSPEVKLEVAVLYRRCLDELNRTRYAAVQEALASRPDDPALAEARAIDRSARYLADHLEEVPLLVFAFGLEGGDSSVFPAVWNLCLAARAEGLGSSITSVLRYARDECHALLGVEPGSEWQMAAMVPIGRPLGRWGLAKRPPAHRSVYGERWGEEPTWRADEPAWPRPVPAGAGQVVVAGWVEVDPSHRPGVVEAFEVMAETSRIEPGCLDYSATADPGHGGRIRVFERWASGEHLDHHLQGQAMVAFKAATAAWPTLARDLQRVEARAVGPMVRPPLKNTD